MTDPVLFGPADPPLLHVMSFNIRRRMGWPGQRHADRWSHRAPALATLLGTERPAFLGVQEALPDQAEFVGDALGAGYRWVGRGRDADDGGERCPVYFDSERLELQDWRQRALSDRPEEAGSVSWGNHIPRILVAATFRDRATGARFVALNTHLDHMSARSRVQSARAIRTLVASASLPVVVTGDLNAGATSPPVRKLLAGGQLVDAWRAARAQSTPAWGTFPHYRAPRRGGRRIDWIMVSPTIEVERTGVNARQPGGVWPSDHLPVQAVVRIPVEGGEA